MVGAVNLKVDGRVLDELQDDGIRTPPDHLRRVLKNRGFIYLRNFHDRKTVLNCRQYILNHFHNIGGILNGDPKNGILNPRCGLGCLPFLEGKNDITHSRPHLAVVEGDRPRKFFSSLLQGPVKTYDTKWLRAMPRDGFTGAHMDWVYMGRGTKNLFTMWTPLDDVDVNMGTLAVLDGSRYLPSYQKIRDTYGQLDVEKANLKGTGWLTEDPLELVQRYGGVWRTTNFRAGDVLIFDMWTMHMSTTNITEKVRLSCDTRWQRADELVDPRYFGENPFKEGAKYGAYAKNMDKAEDSGVTMPELRKQWSLL